jgi:hypothetical protein
MNPQSLLSVVALWLLLGQGVLSAANRDATVVLISVDGLPAD